VRRLEGSKLWRKRRLIDHFPHLRSPERHPRELAQRVCFFVGEAAPAEHTHRVPAVSFLRAVAHACACTRLTGSTAGSITLPADRQYQRIASATPDANPHFVLQIMGFYAAG
jgi:hypothetical protein